MLAGPVWQLLDDRHVLVADCIEAMRSMPPESVDAIVTDPPYGIGFMGHEWDQPGEYGPVGLAEDVPLQGARRRRSQPKPESGAGHARERKPLNGHGKREGARFGGPSGQDNTTHSIRGGAMHAGRYDLSLTANQRFQAWCEAWAYEARRVLKPGGHMLVCGGTRTFHRMAAGVEDAGFDIRDCLTWLYGSGFPKSRDAAKALRSDADRRARDWFLLPHGPRRAERRRSLALKAAVELEGQAVEWEGWGSALKPCWEPIVVARKPLTSTLVANLCEHSTGGLNIDGCRIGADGGGARWPANAVLTHMEECRPLGVKRVKAITGTAAGRMAGVPSAVYGDYAGAAGAGRQAGLGDADGLETVEAWDCAPGCPVRLLDEQTGELRSGANPTRRGTDKFRTVYNPFPGEEEVEPARGADQGGASRFFYCAKASAAERNAGLQGREKARVDRATGHTDGRHWDIPGSRSTPRANTHPTVKPIELMRWLIRLITPPGGVVLDPFSGSGTTACAAVLEGFVPVGIERDPEYASIAEARIAWWAAHPEGIPTPTVFAADRERQAHAERGQLSIEDAA